MAAFAGTALVDRSSDPHHPSQVLSDYTTLTESVNDTNGLRVTGVGDGNNVCRSSIYLVPDLA